MAKVPAVAVHVLDALALGAFAVVTPIPLNLVLFAIWAFLVRRWVKRSWQARGRRAGAAELVIQIATMSARVLAADCAPVKVVDRVKARRVTLPKQTLTIAELEDPYTLSSASILRHAFGAPDSMSARVIRFPSRELTLGQVIATVEAQSPLRHKFHHCGNGTTILWGGDCSFGVRFSLPSR